MNEATLQIVLRKVGESYEGEQMEIGDEVCVALNDSTVIVGMAMNEKHERELKVNVIMGAPIVLDLDFMEGED